MPARTHLITGAGHFPGIGSQLAVDLIELGDNVSICSRSFDTKWDELATAYPNQVHLLAGDLQNETVQQIWIQSVLDKWKTYHSIINNASPSGPAVFDGDLLSRESWQNNLMLNLMVPYELAVRSKDTLLQNNGCVINVGSKAGIQNGIGNNLAYSVSKAGLHHLTRELALTLAPIRVNAVAPGFIMSQRFKSVFPDSDQKRQNSMHQNLLKKEMPAQAVSQTILYLINAEYITGQVVNAWCTR
jgi:NAD(P)-dependent dehydrogenase (short-subunit alcohol dehydrogenase family)